MFHDIRILAYQKARSSSPRVSNTTQLSRPLQGVVPSVPTVAPIQTSGIRS
jgi:hypothetical protein